MSAFRLDYGTLGKAQATPQGGLAIPASLTRSGVFTYYRDGNAVREWRPRAEVERQATLDSLKNAPVTVGHPKPGVVRPDNFERFAKGHVGEDVRMDGERTVATVYVQSKDALTAIEKGAREVSCGYHCDTDEHGGIVPEGEPDAGQRYDRVQRNILYNHAAVVPHGRAGTHVRLHLDAQDNAVNDEEPMADKKIEVLAGIEYECGTDAHRAAKQRQDEADKARDAEVAKLRKDAADAAGALAAAKVRLDALEAADKVRADAAERDALVKKGAAVLGKDWKADGLDNAAIVKAIIAKQYPAVRLDEVAEAERPAFVKGLLVTIKDAPAEPAPRMRQDAKPVPFPGTQSDGGRPMGIVQRIRQDAMDECAPMEGGRPRFSTSRRKAEPALQPTMIENQR